MATENTETSAQASSPAEKPTTASDVPEGPTLARAQQLLQSNDDTHRLVGLGLLKSFLDNSPELRDDRVALGALWKAVPGKFLDGMIRKALGSSIKSEEDYDVGEEDIRVPQWEGAQGKDMIDLAVSVLHKFITLLSDKQKRGPRFLNRMPMLMEALLKSPPETTTMILQILISLTVFPEGANVFMRIKDISSLVELAPQHPEALDVLCNFWLGATSFGIDTIKDDLTERIDKTLITLCLGFKGTDAVTLLAFAGRFFRDLDAQFLPESPSWLAHLVSFIHNLTRKRPSAEARTAYITAAAALLLAYPIDAPSLIFKSGQGSDEKPASYLLLNLILIDIRSSLPTLLGTLNSPTYAPVSYRLTCAFDIVSSFTSFLVRSLDSVDDDEPLPMEPDLLLKLRKTVGETMSVTIEYLRDRWDAAHAGAMGLHPDARSNAPETASGILRLPIAWESATGEVIEEDALILAALRALALWVRDDEGELLRKEASGLSDMLMELYQSSTETSTAPRNPKKLDFRSPVLMIVEALAETEDCVEIVIKHEAWETLTKDLVGIIHTTSQHNDEGEAARGIDIVRVLLAIIDASSSAEDKWLDLITDAARWEYPASAPAAEIVAEFHMATLQLICALGGKLHPARLRRYRHSFAAIRETAQSVGSNVDFTSDLKDCISDIIEILGGLCM